MIKKKKLDIRNLWKINLRADKEMKVKGLSKLGIHGTLFLKTVRNLQELIQKAK